MRKARFLDPSLEVNTYWMTKRESFSRGGFALVWAKTRKWVVNFYFLRLNQLWDEIPLRVYTFHTFLFITRGELFPRNRDAWNVFEGWKLVVEGASWLHDSGREETEDTILVEMKSMKNIFRLYYRGIYVF